MWTQRRSCRDQRRRIEPQLDSLEVAPAQGRQIRLVERRAACPRVVAKRPLATEALELVQVVLRLGSRRKRQDGALSRALTERWAPATPKRRIFQLRRHSS
jgi:hypothetical protein